jgi:ArsR family transcriptional regulator, arsenate/arsenite/antimonite-responsive transcriptional repressor
MNNVKPLDRATADEYASWFKALGDGTRIQIVSLLARRGEPMSVGEIVAAVDVVQSTVSAHLKQLAEVRFVLVERRGTAAYYRIKPARRSRRDRGVQGCTRAGPWSLCRGSPSGPARRPDLRSRRRMRALLHGGR